MAKLNEELWRSALNAVQQNEQSNFEFIRTALRATAVNVVEVHAPDAWIPRPVPGGNFSVYDFPTRTQRAYDCRIPEDAILRLKDEYYKNQAARKQAQQYQDRLARDHQESELRAGHPALQQAYEAYQCLLALCADTNPLVRDRIV